MLGRLLGREYKYPKTLDHVLDHVSQHQAN